MTNDMTPVVTIAITGASGAAYALRLLECLVQAERTINLLISKPGQIVLGMETDLKLPAAAGKAQARLTERFQAKPGQIRLFGQDQWTAPVASGSAQTAPMVVCPCTTATLSAIANGNSRNLLERAADVVIKEQKKLILVIRETPLSAIHLEQMLKLARLGSVIMPASPGFYHEPLVIRDLVDFMVARILDHLGIPHSLVSAWGQPETE